MFSKIYNFWQILRGNLWFVPAVFCLLSFGFITAFYYIEIHYLQDWSLPKYVFQGSTDDAKSVTITLLSAMITMATLAISITIVVLSLAASQLGPRLIKAFMADRRTKDFIGLFFATVIACFVLTVILHSRTSEAVTPQLTISLVFVVCFVNLFVLLGFVHHVARSCIADNVIIKVSDDLKSALSRLTKDGAGQNLENMKDDPKWPKDFDQMNTRLFFERSGYVQNIDYKQIMEIAGDHDLRVKINFKAGHFLVKGEDGLRIYSKSKQSDEIEGMVKGCFIVGDSRTPTQDLEYSVRHLVEIAIRALSPGINDSFTAMSVLDHLSEGLAILFEKETPSEGFYDKDGVKRIDSKQSDEADLIFTAFDQIRHNGRTMPSIIRHLIEKFTILAELVSNEDGKHALLRQVNALEDDLDNIKNHVIDMKSMKESLTMLVKELGR